MENTGTNYVSKGHTLQYLLQQFWGHEYEAAHYCDLDPKAQPLPLARIKKVMKSDREVKMISSEAPILFAKACEIFISEITIRAWQHAEENRRRTLQRTDVAAALARSDQFDFLIDLLPRDDFGRTEVHHSAHVSGQKTQGPAAKVGTDFVTQSSAATDNFPASNLVTPNAIDAPVASSNPINVSTTAVKEPVKPAP